MRVALALLLGALHSAAAFRRECVEGCERLLLSRLGEVLPNNIWVLNQLTTGTLIANRTVIDGVCSVYIGIRLCNWECAETSIDRDEIFNRNAALEKLCIRKKNVVTKQLPCMERMAETDDPECCQKCQYHYGSCGDRVTLLNEVQGWVQDLRSHDELYPLSQRLTKLCGLIVCQLDCKRHRMLRYCTPEAVFLMLEMAGTPFVPLQKAMKRRNAYDYWPDDCRELAVAASGALRPPVLLLLSLLLRRLLAS